MKIVCLLLLISSCTHYKEKQLAARESWKGHSVLELRNHPYFKNLVTKKIQHKNGSETWILRDSSKFQTSAYCESLGGCMGLPTYDCESIFSVKDDAILSLEQNGSCPGSKTIQRR